MHNWQQLRRSFAADNFCCKLICLSPRIAHRSSTRWLIIYTCVAVIQLFLLPSRGWLSTRRLVTMRHGSVTARRVQLNCNYLSNLPTTQLQVHKAEPEIMGLYIYLFHNKMPNELSYDKSYATAEPLESGLHTLWNQSPHTTLTDAKL